MQLKNWSAGLALCTTLLLILSLSMVNVEGKRGQSRRRYRSRGKKPRSQELGTITTAFERKGRACPNSGEMTSNISELWKEVQHLSNPIHIHVHGGHAWSDHPEHVNHHFPERAGDKGDHHLHSSGGKGHHYAHAPGGKGHILSDAYGGQGHHQYSPKGKSGKRHRHSYSPGKHKLGSRGKGSGHWSYSPHGHHPTHETHVHVHITLDTEKDKCDKFIAEQYEDYAYAQCDLIAPEKGSPVTGTILMRQKFNETLEVKVNISGMAAFRPRDIAADDNSEHGLHVHQFADFSQGCSSFGSHFNPTNTTHGPENHEESHSGDWGNIECDKEGNCEASLNITNSVLLGPSSIVGRGIVLHHLKDDLGQGGDEGSLKTGNAGKRLACCGIVRTGPSNGDW